MKTVGIIFGVVLAIVLLLFATGIAQQLMGWAFMAFNSPTGKFDPTEVAPAPDYGKRANWAARPEMQDPADLVPVGVAESSGAQLVDTFFIHPTGYLNAASWTSPMNAESGTEENTQWMMANQASAFNGCCNVYAPRYREATIFSYFGETADRDAVLAFAYEDVKRAFEHYLEHDNQGRPFIIASHSQGTHHALRLLSEVIDATDLHTRFVAGYLIGAVLIPVSPAWLASLANIGACQSADDVHCVVHWDTMPDGADPIERPAPSLCTNPLSWRTDEAVAAAELNDGAVVPEGQFNATFGRAEDAPTGQVLAQLDAPIRAHTWAQCRSGSLYVAKQEGNDFANAGGGIGESYHGLDYALFYMNIRNNAQRRVASFLARQGRP